MADFNEKMMVDQGASLPKYVDHKIKDLGDGTFAPSVYVSGLENKDFIYQQTVVGNSFVWGSTNIPGVALATNFRCYINNPTASNKTLYIYSLVIDNGGGAIQTASLLAQPTTNLPTTSRSTGQNMNMGSAVIAGTGSNLITMYADLGAVMGGGVALPSPFLASGVRNAFLEDEQVLVVPQGYKVGLNVPIGIGVGVPYQVVIYGLAY